jgi:hypothetical protein
MNYQKKIKRNLIFFYPYNIIKTFNFKLMKKYIDFLNELKKLTPEQLECDIKILRNGDLVNENIEIIVDDNPLYVFNDTNMENYYAFETEENAEEYNCEKILNQNYPIIGLF